MYVAKRGGAGIVITNTRGKRLFNFAASSLKFRGSDPMRLMGPALNGVTSGLYRGAIEVRLDGSGVTSINQLDMDSYIRGVVAGEMPSSWPLEALKVQAVAARTYALSTAKSSGAFDQYPDTRSQVYRGVTGESVRSDAAVADTARQIVTYDGVPAVTYYFSTSGGQTENVEFSFIGSLSKPWLVSVPDPYDNQSPYHRWTVRFSSSRLDRALGAPGAFKRLKVLERGESPRVVRAQVIGTRGKRTVSGPQVRAALGLRDTWFTDYRVASSSVRPRSARPASWGPRPREARILAGSFVPAPHTRVLGVERRDSHGRWQFVRRARTSRSGAYRVAVSRAGAYRVSYGAVNGPAVRVR
jgi:stage II sporulation protein D